MAETWFLNWWTEIEQNGSTVWINIKMFIILNNDGVLVVYLVVILNKIDLSNEYEFWGSFDVGPLKNKNKQ